MARQLKHLSSNKETYQYHLSNNNLRILSEYIPHVRSVSIGVWVLTGLQHETSKKIQGITHFLEHMLFKGTTHRTAQQIASELESVGGYIEAFTTREYTCFHVRVLTEHVPLVFELLADILNHPKFDPEDVEKEKQVIGEEIRMFHNNPAEVARELFCATIWKDYYLGQSILGQEESILGFTADLLQAHWRKFYHTGQVIVATAGNIRHDDVVRLSDRIFSFPEGPRTTLSMHELPMIERQSNLHHIAGSSTRSFLCLGTRCMSHNNENRYALYLLSTILGYGMSSRLFQALRERNALVYGVSSIVDLFRESGLFAIDFGVEIKNAQKALNIVMDELFWLCEEGVTEEELNRARNQHKASTVISLEITSNRMKRIATQEIHHMRRLSVDEIIERIDRVTTNEIKALAHQIFDRDSLSLAAVGPEGVEELIY